MLSQTASNLCCSQIVRRIWLLELIDPSFNSHCNVCNARAACGYPGANDFELSRTRLSSREVASVSRLSASKLSLVCVFETDGQKADVTGASRQLPREGIDMKPVTPFAIEGTW